MIIQVDIPDEEIIAAVNSLGKSAFAPPGHFDRKGAAGYELILKAVETHVAAMDIDSLIKTAVGPMVEKRLDEILIVEVDRKIKSRLKAMEKEGKITFGGKGLEDGE